MLEPYTSKVGATYDPQEIKKFLPEQVLRRSIIDPAFSDYCLK